MAKQKYHIKGTYKNNLKLYRERAGLSQERLANLCDCTRTYISAIEQGNTRLTLKMAKRFSEYLHVDPYELLGRDAIKYTGGFLQALNSLVLSNFDIEIQGALAKEVDDQEWFTYMICFLITTKKIPGDLMRAIFTTVDSMTSHIDSKDTAPELPKDEHND